MSKKKKILSLIAAVLLILLTIVSYKIIEVLKSVQCEKEVFSNPEYRGGDEFRDMRNNCMKEKNIIELIKKDIARQTSEENGKDVH
jgi:hypothetical protein